MNKSLMKERFFQFIAALITGTLLGYLSHDLMNGIFNGLLIGIGFITGMELIRRVKKTD